MMDFYGIHGSVKQKPFVTWIRSLSWAPNSSPGSFKGSYNSAAGFHFLGVRPNIGGGAPQTFSKQMKMKHILEFDRISQQKIEKQDVARWFLVARVCYF